MEGTDGHEYKTFQEGKERQREQQVPKREIIALHSQARFLVRPKQIFVLTLHLELSFPNVVIQLFQLLLYKQVQTSLQVSEGKKVGEQRGTFCK